MCVALGLTLENCFAETRAFKQTVLSESIAFDIRDTRNEYLYYLLMENCMNIQLVAFNSYGYKYLLLSFCRNNKMSNDGREMSSHLKLRRSINSFYLFNVYICAGW